MSPPLQAVGSILLLLICICVGQPIAAQSVMPAARLPEQLTKDEIVSNMIRKNLERAQALSAFQGTRVYHLEHHGFPGSRSAEMIVDVKYQSPAKKEFTIRSSSGSRILIEKVFNKLLEGEQEALTEENQSRVALNNENYSFTLAGQENTPAGSYYVLAVEPRTTNKLLYRGRIWVDATDFAVARIEAAPAKRPSFWIKDTKIEHVYIKVGDFWLPTSNRSTSTTRLGGHAVLTIDYSDYRVIANPARADSKETIASHR
jgi:hypothetical protein